MTHQQKAAWFIQHPAALGRALGYADLTDDIHGLWLREIAYGRGDITLQAHRGSYKTSCLTLAIALLMLKERDKNIIFLRKTDDDIAEVIKAVRRILSEPIFNAVYTALTNQTLQIVRDNNAEITLDCYSAPRGAAQLQGIGIGGSLTGKHADIIITDDIVNLRDRLSRAERDRTKAIYQELQNIRNPGGRIINTGTPWHPDDAFTLMPAPQKWDCYHTGLLSQEQIETLRHSMAPSLFAANYELQHIAAENALFTTAPTYTKDETFLRDGIAHIDAAYGGEDYTAFTCGKRIENKLYMYGRMWHSHVDMVIETILAEVERLQVAPVYCEDNADKGFLSKEIRRRKADLPVRVYHEKENKYQKISQYLRKWWGDIIWLQGTDPEYIRQIMNYTEDAEHDDAPDSASCVCRIFDRRALTEYKSPFGG